MESPQKWWVVDRQKYGFDLDWEKNDKIGELGACLPIINNRFWHIRRRDGLYILRHLVGNATSGEDEMVFYILGVLGLILPLLSLTLKVDVDNDLWHTT